jgi:uncharacterized protein (DUF885 family)
VSSPFETLVDEFLATTWRDNPTVATAMGVHDDDDQLGDFSASAWETRRRHLAEFERRTAGIDAGTLSPAERIDHRLLTNHLSLTQAVWAARPPWSTDPGLYANLPADSLFTLLVREFAPLSERARSMLGRLRQVPSVIAEGRRTLDRPARVHTEIAAEMVGGSAQFLEVVIPSVAERVPEIGGELRGAAETAAAALKEYERFLREELLPRSTGEFAVGRALFDRILVQEHALDLDADDLDRIGREAVAETRAQMEAVAASIDGGMAWPELVQRAKAEHVASAGEVKPAYVDAMERARRFVIDHELASLPPGETLEIIDTPEYWRPLMPYAAYMPPAPFEPDQKGFFFVTPVDSMAPPERQAAQLQGHNRYHMEIVALHEAYPGHHLQLVRANRHPSRLRRFFTNNVFCEGWALYCEQLMRELGFMAGPTGHLMQLRDQLWRACRVVVDAGLHTRGMSVEEAVRWLVEEARLEQPNAVAEVKRYTTSPTQPMSYLIGKLQLLRLRDDYRAREAGRFTLRAFHDALLSHGTLPPALVREEMFG